MSSDGAMSGSGATASCGLFAEVAGRCACSPALDGARSGSRSIASCGTFAAVPGRVDSSSTVDGAMFGAAAVWACAATEDTNTPAAMSCANLLWMVIRCVSFGSRSRPAPQIAHHPLVSRYLGIGLLIHAPRLCERRHDP